MFKTVKTLVTSAVALASMTAVSAYAALPAAATTAIAEGQADGIELGGALLGMGIAVGVVFWLKRKV